MTNSDYAKSLSTKELKGQMDGSYYEYNFVLFKEDKMEKPNSKVIIKFNYTDKKYNNSDRIVIPIENKNGKMYAYDLHKKALRVFNLEGIKNVKMIDSYIELPDYIETDLEVAIKPILNSDEKVIITKRDSILYDEVTFIVTIKKLDKK